MGEKLQGLKQYLPQIGELPDIEIDFENMHVEPIISVGELQEFAGSVILDKKKMQKLMGCEIPPSSILSNRMSCTFSGPITQEQIRKHRKKRINKKWAKRYGYRKILKSVQLRDVSIVGSHDDSIDVLGYSHRFLTEVIPNG